MAHDSKALANEVIRRGEKRGLTFTHLQVQKLVYYCHGWMLGIYGEPMIKQDIRAWKYGPVEVSLFHALKKHGPNKIEQPIWLARRQQFSPREKLVIDQSLEIYGILDGMFLSEMTHAPGSPWDEVMKDKGEGAIIPNELIESEFKEKFDRHLKRTGQTRDSLEKMYMEHA